LQLLKKHDLVTSVVIQGNIFICVLDSIHQLPNCYEILMNSCKYLACPVGDYINVVYVVQTLVRILQSSTLQAN